MKKTILTALTAAILAGSAMAADAAGKLVIYNHAAGVVATDDMRAVPGTTNNRHEMKDVLTGQQYTIEWDERWVRRPHSISPRDGNVVKVGIEWAGYGLQEYQIPSEGERHIHVHGNGFTGFWYTESEFGAKYMRR